MKNYDFNDQHYSPTCDNFKRILYICSSIKKSLYALFWSFRKEINVPIESKNNMV